MARKLLITFVSVLIFFLIFVAYLSIYGFKTEKFNNFIIEKVKEHNSKLSLNLNQVFVQLNLSQSSIKISTENVSFVSENYPVKVSKLDINLSILKFIKNENSIKNIKIKSSENSIKNLTSLLNSIDYNLDRYKFFSQIKKGFINFELETKYDLKKKNNYSYNITGVISDAELNLIGHGSLKKINFNFKTKDNITRITNLLLNYQDLNLFSKEIKVIKETKDTYKVEGDLSNNNAYIDPNLLLKFVNFNQDYLSEKDILLQTKNSFTFNFNSRDKIQNLKINSIIDFDEIYFNKKYQQIIFLKKGKINLKYQPNNFYADLYSKFSFLGQKDFDLDYKNNDLKVSLVKENDKNTKISGLISNKKTLLNSKIFLDLFKLNSNLFSSDMIKVATDNKFEFEIDNNKQFKNYTINSNINLDKLSTNKDFQNLIFLKNVKTNIIIKENSLKVDLNSNYSFFNKKYNNSEDNNLFNLKLISLDKINSNVDIYLNTKNNSINTKEFKSLLKLDSKYHNDQIVKLNSNFFINFSMDKNYEIKNFNFKSDLILDSLELKYQSKNIKKYVKNYQNKFILNEPRILIDYSNDKTNIQIDGKYTLNERNDNIFIKAKRNKNNFEIYSSLNLNQNIINISEFEYSKKEKIPSNLEFTIKFNEKEKVIKKLSFIENDNKLLINNFHISDKRKILKFDEIFFKYLNDNKVFNNLKIRKISNNYSVTGINYDVEKFLESLLKSDNKNKVSKIFDNISTTIKFDIESLYLEKKFYLDKFNGEIDIKNNKVFLAKLNANLNKVNKFSYSFRTTSKDEKITNIFIQKPKPFINNYKFIMGFEDGELKLNSKKIENISRSNLKITNFKVKEVPVLAKILTLASLQGIADLLTGEGIRFNELEMDFKNKNNLIEVEEMYAIGPSISIMLEGYIEKNQITSLKGTLVPATTINKTIAKIPLIGNLLVGSKTGEGVFGVSFKIKGKPNDLKSTVNPIKTLTPRFITRTLENLKGS